ncbi:acyltransferase family protein [Acinetobacter baumannii]
MHLEWVNRIKGLSILLVIFHHSVVVFYNYLPDTNFTNEAITFFWQKLNVLISPLRMPVFFFISGLLVYKYVNIKSLRDSFDKRISSIFYVLALWITIQVITVSYFNKLMGYPVNHTIGSNVFYFDSLSNLTQSILIANTSLWYLYALIIYFLLFKLVCDFKKSALIFCGILSIITGFTSLVGWGMDSIIRNAVFFGLGCYFGPEIIEKIKEFDFHENVFKVIILGIVSVIFLLLNLNIISSLFSIFIIIKLFMLIDKKNNVLLSCLSNIGKNTLPIYVSHRIFLEFASVLLLMMIFNGYLGNASLSILLVIYPIFSTFFITLLSLKLKVFSDKYLGGLLFSKPKFKYLKSPLKY